MQKKELSAEDILQDALSFQKQLTSTYNIASNEVAGNNGLRSDMLSILMEEHELQSAMFNAAREKGWYQTDQASQQQVLQVLQRYSKQ